MQLRDTIRWESFPDGFPNLFIEDAKNMAGKDGMFLRLHLSDPESGIGIEFSCHCESNGVENGLVEVRITSCNSSRIGIRIALGGIKIGLCWVNCHLILQTHTRTCTHLHTHIYILYSISIYIIWGKPTIKV